MYYTPLFFTLDISDHFPIFHLTSNTGVEQQGIERFPKCWVFSAGRINRFETLIDDVLWDDVHGDDDAELAYHTFTAAFNSIFNTPPPPFL